MFVVRAAEAAWCRTIAEPRRVDYNHINAKPRSPVSDKLWLLVASARHFRHRDLYFPIFARIMRTHYCHQFVMCHTKHRSTGESVLQTIKIFISLDRMVEVFAQRAKVHQIKIFENQKKINSEENVGVVIQPVTMPHKINCRVITRSDATPPSGGQVITNG